MKKDIKINNKEGTVSITIKLPKRKLATQEQKQVTTRDVIQLLKEEGITFSKTFIKECTLSNEKGTCQHQGTWIFPLSQQQSKPKVPKKTIPPKQKPKKTVRSATEGSPEVPVFAKKTNFQTKVVDKTTTK